MSQSLMQLDDFRLNALDISTRPVPGELDPPEKTERAVSIGFEILENRDKPDFMVFLSIRMDTPEDSRDPFERARIDIQGIFSFPEGTGKGEIEKYVPLLCLTNLFGIARGLISQSTAMCHGGPLLLPLVNMKKLVREYYEEKTGAAGKKSSGEDKRKKNKPSAANKKKKTGSAKKNSKKTRVKKKAT